MYAVYYRFLKDKKLEMAGQITKRNWNRPRLLQSVSIYPCQFQVTRTEHLNIFYCGVCKFNTNSVYTDTYCLQEIAICSLLKSTFNHLQGDR